MERARARAPASGGRRAAAGTPGGPPGVGSHSCPSVRGSSAQQSGQGPTSAQRCCASKLSKGGVAPACRSAPHTQRTRAVARPKRAAAERTTARTVVRRDVDDRRLEVRREPEGHTVDRQRVPDDQDPEVEARVPGDLHVDVAQDRDAEQVALEVLERLQRDTRRRPLGRAHAVVHTRRTAAVDRGRAGHEVGELRAELEEDVPIGVLGTRSAVSSAPSPAARRTSGAAARRAAVVARRSARPRRARRAARGAASTFEPFPPMVPRRTAERRKRCTRTCPELRRDPCPRRRPRTCRTSLHAECGVRVRSSVGGVHRDGRTYVGHARCRRALGHQRLGRPSAGSPPRSTQGTGTPLARRRRRRSTRPGSAARHPAAWLASSPPRARRPRAPQYAAPNSARAGSRAPRCRTGRCGNRRRP
jgi:hypothetical protein